MIERQRLKDKEVLLELCLLTHPTRESKFLESFFSDAQKQELGFCIKEEGKVISCMQSKEHTIVLKDKALLTSFIFAVATHVDYRSLGYMDALMNYMLDQASHNYLISFVEAYNPKLYKKYGFETISSRKKLSISKRDIPMVDFGSTTYEVEVAMLVSLYNQFAKHFDCYYVRDVEYYEDYLRYVALHEGTIVLSLNEHGVPNGYCTYYVSEDNVEVTEIIYFDSNTLFKLLFQAIEDKNYLVLEVSNHEQVEKIFKHSVPREHTCVMARINNYTLFNKLFDCKLKSVKELSNMLNKPILINEKN